MATSNYQNILMDLMETTPLDSIVMPDSCRLARGFSSNIRHLYRMIRWSLVTEDRVSALVNAYYLGKLLETKLNTPRERSKYRRILTEHYNTTSIRIYNLFSIVGIQQIYRTQRTSLWMYRRITR